MILSKWRLILPLVLTSLVSSARAEDLRFGGITTSQDDINSGTLSLPELFYRGAHFFVYRFTTADGLGEAPDGPRRANPAIPVPANSPFLRINGLDATSCIECHGRPHGSRQTGLLSIVELGSAGSAGSISTAQISIVPGSDPPAVTTLIPPSLHGLGYLQRLAEEMTADLSALVRQGAIDAQAQSTPVTVELVSQGVSFGSVIVSNLGGIDFSNLQGISNDLVVRPFQAKGITSSLRVFVGGALNFHFSLQASERIRRNLIANDNPNGTLVGDVSEEIDEGDVSTLTIFSASLRPPHQDLTGLDAASVTRGRALMDSTGCTACHVASLRIADTRLTILDPRQLTDANRPPGYKKSDYVSMFNPSAPPMNGVEPDSTDLQSRLPTEKTEERLPGYTFDLSSPDLPGEARPRLVADGDGSVAVPLFSDLRRHRMGTSLKSVVPQPTEVPTLVVPVDEFLTAPLWGVADAGPWLHDGRATTLREAISFHASQDSEASASITNFQALNAAQQEDLLEFLRSLRVPAPGPSQAGEFLKHGFVTY